MAKEYRRSTHLGLGGDLIVNTQTPPLHVLTRSHIECNIHTTLDRMIVRRKHIMSLVVIVSLLKS